MVQLWDNLDNFKKFKTLFLLFSLLFFLMLYFREFLKMTDKDCKYNHPKFLSVMSLFFFLSVDGFFSFLFMSKGLKIPVSEIIGGVLSIIMTPLCFLLSKKFSAFVRKSKAINAEQLVNCTGMAASDINSTGGNVCVNYNDKFIDARAVSNQEIKNGEEIIVTGLSGEVLVCKKK